MADICNGFKKTRLLGQWRGQVYVVYWFGKCVKVFQCTIWHPVQQGCGLESHDLDSTWTHNFADKWQICWMDTWLVIHVIWKDLILSQQIKDSKLYNYTNITFIWKVINANSKKVLGLNPGFRLTWVLSLWNLHVLPVSAWVSCRFPPTSKDLQVMWMGNSKSPEGVNEFVCLYVSALWWTGDLWTLPLTQ